MTDISFALQAKSDQTNAVDIMGSEPIWRIRQVDVKQSSDQPVWIYYEGDNNRPWKPSKGMLRVLARAWGNDSQNWVGKCVQPYFEPSVTYAGQEVGGIRIKALSDIPESGLQCIVTISRTKRQPYHVQHLKIEQAEYPQDKFQKGLPKMIEMMQSGEWSLQQVIAQCQKTGQLTQDQLAQLEKNAPIETQDDELME